MTDHWSCGYCGSDVPDGSAWWPIYEQGVLCAPCAEYWTKKSLWQEDIVTLTAKKYDVLRAIFPEAMFIASFYKEKE